MSMKHDHAVSPGADKDPFAQLSQGIERSVRKKKALNDDDVHQDSPATAHQQAHDVAAPAQSQASASAAAVLMSPREFDQLTYQARVVAKVNTGLADIEAGRVRDADEVFDELDAELAPAPRKRKTTKR